MEIGIIAPSILVGRMHLNKRVGEMRYKDVVYSKRDEALMNDGDHYRVFIANDNKMKGYRFDKVIISKNIPIDFVKTIGEYLSNSNENQVEFFE